MKSDEELALALVADSVSRLIGAWNISKFSGNGWLSCKLNGGDLRIEEGSVVFWNMERVEEAWVLCHLMDSELTVRMPDMPSELYQEVRIISMKTRDRADQALRTHHIEEAIG